MSLLFCIGVVETSHWMEWIAARNEEEALDIAHDMYRAEFAEAKGDIADVRFEVRGVKRGGER